MLPGNPTTLWTSGALQEVSEEAMMVSRIMRVAFIMFIILWLVIL